MSGSASDVVVSSGQVSSGLIISGANSALILPGGTAVETLVTAGGHVGNLGLAISTSVTSRGDFVDSAGNDSRTYIGAGGTETAALQPYEYFGGDNPLSSAIYAYSGAAFYTNIADGGELIVQYEAIGAVVQSGGVLLVSSGAIAQNVDVQSGGIVVVVPGGTETGSGVSVPAGEIVALYGDHASALGASGTSATVVSGEQLLLLDAVINNVTILAGGTVTLYSGSVIGNLTVSSGAAATLSAGTLLYGNVAAGGQLLLTSALYSAGSGTVVATASAAGLVISGVVVGAANLDDPIVAAGGTLYNSVGDAAHTMILSGGIARLADSTDTFVESGGQFDAVGSNGAFYMAPGAVLGVLGAATNGFINSGATIFIASNDVLANATIVSGAVIIEAPGGQISGGSNGASPISSGVVLVDAGQSVTINPLTPVTVSSGAYEIVLTGSLASGTTVLSAGVQYVDGGTAVDATLMNGATQQVISGTALKTIVQSGATLTGGSYGIVSGATVYAGGLVTGDGSGTGIFDTVVSSGGKISVYAEQTSGSQIKAGGIELVHGMVAYDTTVFAGGTDIDTGAGDIYGGTDYGAIIKSGGLMFDEQQASGTTVSAGGFMLVTEFGTAISTYVASGGFELLVSGGVASATTGPGDVLAGGVVVVSADGAYSVNPQGAVALSGGGLEVAFGSGVVASGLTIGSGARQIAFTNTSDTLIQAGGVQIQSAGVAYNSLLVGGTQIVTYEYGPTSSQQAGIASNTTIGTSGVLDFENGALSGAVNFTGSGGILDDTASYFTSVFSGPQYHPDPLPVISGFAAGDGIILPFDLVPGTSPVISGNTVIFNDIYGNQVHGSTLSLTLANVVASDLTFVEDYNALTTTVELTALCFLAGTHIAVPGGGVAVERLRIGDAVLTERGPKHIKWLGKRAYAARFVAGEPMAAPVKIAAGALADGVPARDVYVSPGHGVLLDGHLVPAWRLLNGESIAQPTPVQDVLYTHIELEDHAIVYAEGMPAETFLEESLRGRFQNAGDYYAMYPGPVPNRPFCYPRLEDGFLLQSVRQRLARRAGLKLNETTGRLLGALDLLQPGRIAGWALDMDNPDRPVCLDVLVFGVPVRRILANQYRTALRAAGHGQGACGFDIALPPNLWGPLSVRRTEDHASLHERPGAAAGAV